MIVCDIIIASFRPASALACLMAEARETAGYPCRLIPTCQEGSAAVNRNYGLNLSTADLVCQLDDDVTGFPQDWLKDLIGAWGTHPNCVMVSPRLINPDGSPGIMLGFPRQNGSGLEVLRIRQLPTACCVMLNTDLRYHEGFTGSGFEDTDFTKQLGQAFPDGQWICNHDVKVVHRNEKKNQGGEFWTRNKALYLQRWGKLE